MSSVVWALIYNGKLANQIARLVAIVVKLDFLGVGGDSVRPKHVKKCMKLNWNFQRGGQPRSQHLSSYRLSLLTPRGGKMRDPGNEVEGWVAGGGGGP